MDPALALGLGGSLFPILEYLGQEIRSYLDGVEEKREVRQRLQVVLQPLDGYKKATAESNEDYEVISTKLDSLSLPVRAIQTEDLVIDLMNFCEDFTKSIAGILEFAKQSRIVASEMRVLMEKVERRFPKFFEIIEFFGMHYDPKTDSLDLAHFPTFDGALGLKVKRPKKKDEKEISDVIEKGGKSVDKAIQVAKSIGQQSLKLRNRRLQKEFPARYKQMLKEIGKLKATAEVATELSKNAPPWILEIAEILGRVEKTLPELSKPVYRYSIVHGGKSTYHKK